MAAQAGRPAQGSAKTVKSLPPSVAPELEKSSPMPDAEAWMQPWFKDARGQQAIAAAQRGQDDRARVLLSELSKDRKITPADRQGATLLLALDELDRGEHQSAARRLSSIWSSPELSSIADEIVDLAARAWVRAGMTTMAHRQLENAKKRGIAGPKLQLCRAAVLESSGDTVRAVQEYEAVARGGTPYAAEAILSATSLLLGKGDDASRRKAAKLFANVDRFDLSRDQKRRAEYLRNTLSPEDNGTSSASYKKGVSPAVALSIAKVQSLYRARKYNSAKRSASKALRNKKLSHAENCELLYWKGSSIFRNRDRAGAAASFLAGEKSCRLAKNRELEVKCAFQGSRGLFAKGRYAEAARAFEALAKKHSDHSYADDSLVFAGEAWESAQNTARAQAAFHRVLSDFPKGDQQAEARRRLLLLAFSQRRHKDVLALVDSSVRSGTVGGRERAKLLYFRGRAKARLGDVAGAKGDYLEVVRSRPLSYAALHAWSRLREMDPKLWAAEIQRNLVQQAPSQSPSLALPDASVAQRAVLWARMGVRDRVRTLLEDTAIDGWPAVATLALAGDWFASQRTLAKMDSAWREAPPNGPMRTHWELAHPIPFSDLILPQERQRKLPPLLSFAIIQTESRFDPSQASWAGARGLMQLMPGTARYLAKKLGLGRPSTRQLHDPTVNINMGVYYLSSLVERYGGHEASVALAVPSYNAGPGNVDKWLAKRGDWDLDLFLEAVPFDETRKYASSVLGRWMAYRWIYGGEDVNARLPYLPLKTPRRETL